MIRAIRSRYCRHPNGGISKANTFILPRLLIIFYGYLCIAVLLFGLFFPWPALAYEWNDLQIDAYFSQSYHKTNGSTNYGGEDSVDGSFDVRSLGVSLGNHTWIPRSMLAFQGTYRDFGEIYDNEVEVDYAFIDMQLAADLNYQVGLLLGRHKSGLGFHNDGWDIVHTRPFVLNPIAFYEEIVRDLSYKFDGAQLYGSWEGHGTYSWALSFGRLAGDDERLLEISPIAESIDTENVVFGKIQYDSSLTDFSVFYLKARIYLKHNSLDVLQPVPTPMGTIFIPAFQDGDSSVDVDSIGFLWNLGKFTLTSEARIQEADLTEVFSASTPNFDEAATVTGEIIYFAINYAFNSSFSAYWYTDWLWNDNDDRRGEQFEVLTGNPGFVQYRRAQSIGFRYDATQRILLGAQITRTHGAAATSLRENPVRSAQEEAWSLLVLTFAIRF